VRKSNQNPQTGQTRERKEREGERERERRERESGGEERERGRERECVRGTRERLPTGPKQVRDRE